jgi:hypothetical protein
LPHYAKRAAQDWRADVKRHLRHLLSIEGKIMDMVVILIVLLLLFGGGGGLYWGLGAGWGIGPIGLIVAVIVVAFLLNSRRTRL